MALISFYAVANPLSFIFEAPDDFGFGERQEENDPESATSVSIERRSGTPSNVTIV